MDNDRGIKRPTGSTPSVKKGKKHILGIGINDYRHWSKLRNAINDLDKVVEILTERYDFDAQHITLLTEEKATRRNIVNILHQFTNPSVLGEDDSLLIYFSGHGFLDDNEEGYWVPVDSEKDDIDSFIPNLTIQSKIKNMKCRHVLLISDSCFSGSLMAKGERLASIETLVADELEVKKSRWIITSGGRDEAVSDGMGKNSPFAEAIISELKHNTKSQFIVDELALRVRNITRSNATQMPQVEKMYQAGDLGGRFIFYLKNNEAEDWTYALTQNTVSGFESFQKKYPLSIFRDEADKAILKINKEQLEREHIAIWDSTKRINKAYAYLDFWEKYPQSPYRIEARERLDDAEDNEEWQRTPRTLGGMLSYLDKFTKGLHAADAKATLDDFRNQNLERERLEREKKEKEKIEKEKIERERKEDERVELARLKLKQEKIENERANKERLEQQEREQQEKKLLLEREAALELVRQEEAVKERKRKEQAAKERVEKEKQEQALQEQLTREQVSKSIPPQYSTVSVEDNDQPVSKDWKKWGIVAGVLLMLIILGIKLLGKSGESPSADNGTSTTSSVNTSDPFDGQMVTVDGGTFQMGCTNEQGSDCESGEKPVHIVTLSSFQIGKYEVTQAQWQAIMGNNPSYFKNCDECPVENVSWDDIQEFLKKLNNKTGKNYRLPTEAEWEFAARGGNNSKGYKYTGSNDIGNVAWIEDNSSSKTHPIGQKKANELGIYDMSGNVWEWCSDWYDTYNNTAVSNPTGATKGTARVDRGGSWDFNARYCRVARRATCTPTIRLHTLGFRVILSP